MISNDYTVLYAPFHNSDRDDPKDLEVYKDTYEGLKTLREKANNAAGGGRSWLSIEKEFPAGANEAAIDADKLFAMAMEKKEADIKAKQAELMEMRDDYVMGSHAEVEACGADETDDESVVGNAVGIAGDDTTKFDWDAAKEEYQVNFNWYSMWSPKEIEDMAMKGDLGAMYCVWDESANSVDLSHYALCALDAK